LLVKIGAQDQEISKALTDLVGNARRADADLSKLGSTPLAQQAVKSINDLASKIKGITDTQQKFADRAVDAARGVDTLGGASKLMQRELEQVNKTLQTGLDAFRALGKEAPEDLQKVADAVNKQQEALRSAAASSKTLKEAQTSAAGGTSLLAQAQTALIGQLSTLAGPAVLGFAAKQALDYADTLTKVSDRTGIGVVALQRFDAIAGASGNSLEEIANAVNHFQKQLAGGDAGAIAAVHGLGIELADLKRQSPDQQFITIAKAVQQIPDPAEQARVAMELFGKAGAQLLPTLKADVDQLANSTVQMSAESVKALDDFGDAFGALQKSAVNTAGEILAAFLKTLGVIRDVGQAIKDAANTTGGPAQTTPELLQTQPRFASSRVGAPQPKNIIPQLLGGVPLALPGAITGGAIGALTDLPTVASQSAEALRRVHDEMAALERAAQALGLETEDYEKKLREVNARIAAATRDVGHLTDAQQRAIITYRALGLTTGDISIKLAVSELAVKAYDEALNNQIAAMKASTENTGKLQQELGKLIVGFDAAGKMTVGFHGILHTDFDLPLESAITTMSLATRASATFADQQKRTREALAGQLATNIGLPFVQPQHKKDIEDASRSTVEWRDNVDDLGRAFARLAQVTDGTLGSVVREIGQIVTAFDLASKSAKAFQKAREEGDNVGQAFALASGGAAVLQATGAGSTAARTFGGAASGAAIGSAFTPVGTAIGAAVGGLLGLIRGLGSSPEKQINPIREAFVRAAGGLQELNRKAFEATGSLSLVQQLLSAKNAEQYQAAINALNGALGHHDEIVKAVQAQYDTLSTRLQGVHDISTPLQAALDAAFNAKTPTDFAAALAGISGVLDAQETKQQHANDIIKEFGADALRAGEDFKKAEIDKQAAHYVDAFHTMKDAGFDVNYEMSLMGPKLNDFVRTAQKAGVEVPESMREVLQVAIDSGVLYDENGAKVEHLEDLHLTFGLTAEQAMTDVAAAIQRLVDALTKNLFPNLDAAKGKTSDLARAADEIPDNPFRDWLIPEQQFPRSEFASTGGRVTAQGIQHFGGGGRVLPFLPRGTDRVPAMLTPGEVVLTENQQDAVAAAMNQPTIGLSTKELEAKLDRLERRLIERERRTGELVALAVKNVIAKAG
jgi:hypothetical protein